jgi:hypothetical protein
MDKDRELIHKLLDGELPAEEARSLLERINSHPILKEEFALLKHAVSCLENSGRKAAPLSFASEVMSALPEAKTGRKGLKDFFFRDRVIRWNMAAALAAVFVAVVILGGVFSYRKDRPVSYTNSGEFAVTAKFEFYSPDAKNVSVAGDFNRWSIDEGVMMRRDKGTWTIEIPLKPGTYSYMFVVDGNVWITDPKAGSYRDDGFGNKNSLVRVNRI